jgi:hypothetical protein
MGDTCEDLPGGYCHRRTQQDEEFVKKWKEDKGRGPFIRRRIEDVDASPPSDPFAPAEYEPVDGILIAFDGSSKGTSVYDLGVIAGIAAAVTNQETLTKVYIVANANQKPMAQTEFACVVVNMTRVVWVEQPIDSVWIREIMDLDTFVTTKRMLGALWIPDTTQAAFTMTRCPPSSAMVRKLAHILTLTLMLS